MSATPLHVRGVVTVLAVVSVVVVHVLHSAGHRAASRSPNVAEAHRVGSMAHPAGSGMPLHTASVPVVLVVAVAVSVTSVAVVTVVVTVTVVAVVPVTLVRVVAVVHESQSTGQRALVVSPTRAFWHRLTGTNAGSHRTGSSGTPLQARVVVVWVVVDDIVGVVSVTVVFDAAVVDVVGTHVPHSTGQLRWNTAPSGPCGLHSRTGTLQPAPSCFPLHSVTGTVVVVSVALVSVPVAVVADVAEVAVVGTHTPQRSGHAAWSAAPNIGLVQNEAASSSPLVHSGASGFPLHSGGSVKVAVSVVAVAVVEVATHESQSTGHELRNAAPTRPVPHRLPGTSAQPGPSGLPLQLGMVVDVVVGGTHELQRPGQFARRAPPTVGESQNCGSTSTQAGPSISLLQHVTRLVSSCTASNRPSSWHRAWQSESNITASPAASSRVPSAPNVERHTSGCDASHSVHAAAPALWVVPNRSTQRTHAWPSSAGGQDPVTGSAKGAHRPVSEPGAGRKHCPLLSPAHRSGGHMGTAVCLLSRSSPTLLALALAEARAERLRASNTAAMAHAAAPAGLLADGKPRRRGFIAPPRTALPAKPLGSRRRCLYTEYPPACSRVEMTGAGGEE